MKHASILIVLVLLGACSTPYQPKGFRGGYSDTVLTRDEAIVRFRGNGYTSSESVVDMGLYRCAELTDQRGFRFFVVIESSGQIQTSYMTSTRSTAYGSSGNITPVNKHEAVFHIKMFGVVDRPANAYDAREIMQNVGPKIGASDK